MNELQEVREMLAQPLDTDNAHTLAKQLVDAEAWQARVSVMYRAAEHTLSTWKGKLFNPSLSSEDKRKIDLEYNVRDYQREVSELADLADLLKRRVSLGQTLMKSIETEQKTGLR